MLGLQEGLVECATVCVEIEVILTYTYLYYALVKKYGPLVSTLQLVR